MPPSIHTSCPGVRFRAVGLGLVLAAAAGCQGQAPTTAPSGSAGATAASTAEVTAAATPAVELESVDRPGLDSVVAEHKGQVVLVDFWATWCGPCREQMAHTAALSERLAGQGLSAVTVSLDEPADDKAVSQAQAFLAELPGQMTHCLSAAGGSDAAYEAFEIDNAALPHLKLYDRQGKLRRTFASGDPTARSATPEEIEAAVGQLLAESPPTGEQPAGNSPPESPAP